MSLRGTNQSELAWMSGKQMAKYVTQPDSSYLPSVYCLGAFSSLKLMHGNDGQIELVSPELQSVLDGYEDVFAVPTTLPPQRSCDHKIPLKDLNAVVNVRPYRYPPAQKDAIENMVKELLDSGVIRPSHSPFLLLLCWLRRKIGHGGCVLIIGSLIRSQ